MSRIPFRPTRREALKSISLGALALALGGQASAGAPRAETGSTGRKPYPKPARPITAITLGAGSRGNVYGGYALANADELDIVGVAEPKPLRNERYSSRHAIPARNRFDTWERVFERPKFADAVIISTPDQLHYGPCMAALRMGYDVLLEKPISPSERECRDILALAKQSGRIVAVCHVLRYSPYFIQLKHLIDSGAVGELVSIQHFEPIEHIHMSHSYVRGNWHNSAKSTPIILAKSCHDLDILRWMVGKPSTDIVAMGDLKWFRKENAPVGSTARCTDGCPVEAGCPYSALKVYGASDSGWRYVFDLPEDKSQHDATVLELLKTTDYGRCVYRMDNDQADHYVSTMRFEGGVTASFSMEAFTPWGGRRTRIMGAMGFIEGDMETMVHTDFRTGKTTTWDPRTVDVENYQHSGHGGGDHALVRDWVQAISQKDPGLLTSTIDVSLESHMMGFAAERSRGSGRVEPVKV